MKGRHTFEALRSEGLAAVTGGLVGLSAAAAVLTTTAWAHDSSNTDRFGIVHDDDIMVSGGANDENWNGIRIYLSSPRHSNSGSRGECMNPGRQENVNGRAWNWYAGNHQASYNLHQRGYNARVGRNPKDNDYAENRTLSRNWGADIHVVTHTNALGGPGTGDYTLLMWEHNADARDDRDVAAALRDSVAPDIPGGVNMWQESDLLELATNARWGDAYVELQFHDNCNRQEWLYYNSDVSSWTYGRGIDRYLGYPS